MSMDWMGGVMLLTLLFMIFSGYPVAFALGGTAMLFVPLGIGLGFFDLNLMQALPQRVFGVMDNYTLLAVPFFIFMGTMLEKSGLAEDLLKTMGQLFGPLRGGLALSVVFVGTLLAAATGVVGATVVSMGMIALPVMLRYGYSGSLSTGIIAASGTLGQIIPPSVVLIILGAQLGVPVGSLFVGALVPGLMLAGMYALYAAGVAVFRPNAAPALPPEDRPKNFGRLMVRVCLVMIPPLALIFVVLGSIFTGVATPTEAGAFGSIGAILLAVFSGRFKFPQITHSLEVTVKLSSMVLFILVGSRFFSLVFRGFDGDLWVDSFLTSLPGGQLGFLLAANLVIFILGFFIDFFEIAFIVLPLLAPAAMHLGVDMVWFGIMIGMNLQTSFLTPPFGFSLFYLRGVAPASVTTMQIYKGVIPFIIIQLIGLTILITYPDIVHLLPGS
ncbi:C4-dicarboxylate ABC transporter [Acidihalobacter yilgarnensis]|uniref:TRAP transporter large permease protein n=1 Tax=Acidihalobacter yilgarnensis TaxID=2819280 RepID=A0A1D8IQ41_9GAMM|nr:TRAP transporter large permease subunit [Acidihalobacter yilgarnensis]AOU98567.1 C4-dicarboxylate ABC transporter [Acidihalobacter yilgarnensis]